MSPEEQFAGSSYERSCRLPTARSMTWSSEENSRSASISPHAASSGTWQRSKPGSTLGAMPLAQMPSNVLQALTSGCAVRGPSNTRLQLKRLHRSREQRRTILLAQNPGIQHIGPLLHHMAALMLVFRLVIDATRGPSVFMRQALLDPVAIEAQLIQQGRTCAS